MTNPETFKDLRSGGDNKELLMEIACVYQGDPEARHPDRATPVIDHMPSKLYDIHVLYCQLDTR